MTDKDTKKPSAPIMEDIPIPVGPSAIRLQIDPEQVNRVIVAAVLSSGIGDLVKKHCEEFLTQEKAERYGEKCLRTAVQDHLQKIVEELCTSPEVRERLREKVKAHLTDGLVDEFMEKVVKERLKAWR